MRSVISEQGDVVCTFQMYNGVNNRNL